MWLGWDWIHTFEIGKKVVLNLINILSGFFPKQNVLVFVPSL
jgi:hypothetical protein